MEFITKNCDWKDDNVKKRAVSKEFFVEESFGKYSKV